MVWCQTTAYLLPGLFFFHSLTPEGYSLHGGQVIFSKQDDTFSLLKPANSFPLSENKFWTLYHGLQGPSWFVVYLPLWLHLLPFPHLCLTLWPLTFLQIVKWARLSPASGARGSTAWNAPPPTSPQGCCSLSFRAQLTCPFHKQPFPGHPTRVAAPPPPFPNTMPLSFSSLPKSILSICLLIYFLSLSGHKSVNT